MPETVYRKAKFVWIFELMAASDSNRGKLCFARPVRISPRLMLPLRHRTNDGPTFDPHHLRALTQRHLSSSPQVTAGVCTGAGAASAGSPHPAGRRALRF